MLGWIRRRGGGLTDEKRRQRQWRVVLLPAMGALQCRKEREKAADAQAEVYYI